MRSKPSTPRIHKSDPVYNSVLITQLINKTMYSGKKTVAKNQVYDALKLIHEQTQKDPLTVFLSAIENLHPQMEVRSRRIGGAAYQVPTPVRPIRKDSLALRWLIAAARDRSNSQYHSFAEKLAAEILDAQNSAGAAFKKKTDTHRMAEANKAFAHFRW
jgi:small subunit ribosomal protein S7